MILNYQDKISGSTSLKAKRNKDGWLIMEVWHNNACIALFNMEYVYDFLSDAYLMNPPTEETKELDSGRRYNQMLLSNILAPHLYPKLDRCGEIMDKIKDLADDQR